MSQIIRMTPEELESGARTIKKCLRQMETEVRTITTTINTITDNWEGDAKRAFLEQFEIQMLPFLNNTMPSVLTNICTILETSAAKLKETDSNIAAGFQKR